MFASKIFLELLKCFFFKYINNTKQDNFSLSQIYEFVCKIVDQCVSFYCIYRGREMYHFKQSKLKLNFCSKNQSELEK